MLSIPITTLFIYIIASICLLLWGLKMVRKGFLRGFGAHIKSILALGTQNRFAAFFSGIVATFFLQSSTATILLLSSFAKKNFVSGSMALAIVLGADVCTTLVARLLVLDLSLLSPVLLITGFILHSSYATTQRIQLSYILVGLGLMLLSLSLLREHVTPLSSSETLPYILAPLKTDPIVAIICAALITWFMHSSLASVLFFASLASGGSITPDLGLYMILGANLGGGFIPYYLMFQEKSKIVRRITLGNLLMRLLIVCLILPFSSALIEKLHGLDMDAGVMLVNMHIGFNMIMALMFLPFVSAVYELSKKAVPDVEDIDDQSSPVFLDEKSMDTPVLALASAARETLRMAEFVESMLEKTIQAFQKNDAQLIQRIREEDDIVDDIYHNIKIYMTQLTREELDKAEANRYVQILTFSTNLEYVGDIIDKNLMELAEKKINKQENFSKEGQLEIENFHSKVLENMQLAQNIFMLQDTELARQLVDEKKVIRKAVKKTSEKHFQRLSDGHTESLATSTLHLDIIRDFRRINTYMTAVAYNILDHTKKKSKKSKL